MVKVNVIFNDAGKNEDNAKMMLKILRLYMT